MFIIKHYFASWPYAQVQGGLSNSPVTHLTLTAKLVGRFHDSGNLSDTGFCDFKSPVLSITFSRYRGFVLV
jgi:hypothetical protein